MDKEHSKGHKSIKWIVALIVLYLVLMLCVVGTILYFLSIQYNYKGISNILSVFIDEDREREYIGKLSGYEIYVENLRTEELCFRTINEKCISLKDAIDKKLVSIKDWKRGAWYVFEDNDTELLRYESYEIVLTKNECIIRPVSKYRSIDINCNNFDQYRITLKKGNTFDCELLGKEYHFSIKDISHNNMFVTVSDFGLTKVQDDDINLLSKEKEFAIEKNQKVELSTQSNDSNESIIIEWYDDSHLQK